MMMTFRPHKLRVFAKDAQVLPTENPVVVKLAAPAALYWHRDKSKVLIGYGTEFRVQLPDLDCTLSAGAPGTIEDREGRSVLPTGDVFTNFDKRPMMSPAEQAVTLALRRLARKERELDAARKAADIQAGHVAAPEPDPEPVHAARKAADIQAGHVAAPEPDPEPVPEPAPSEETPVPDGNAASA